VYQLLNYEYLTTEQTRELFAILFQPGAARDFQVRDSQGERERGARGRAVFGARGTA
jgi:hypothetical protein